jgi:hypothetical protein
VREEKELVIDRRFVGILLGLGGLCALGCGRLGSAQARDILQRRLGEAGSTSCIWTHVQGDTYIDVDGRSVRECVQELDKAGIAKAGVCRDKEPSEKVCLARTIVPRGDAKLVKDGLGFRCGEFKLLEVTDVESKSDDLAKVTYVRMLETPLLADIPHCTTTTLYRPDEGQRTKTLYFKRVDGRWDVQDEPSGWLY